MEIPTEKKIYPKNNPFCMRFYLWIRESTKE